MNKLELGLEFKSDTPELPDVKIIDAWGYYDGPLIGVCEVHNKEFFFMDVIYDIWRCYDNDTHQRLWSIFGVYDMPIKQARKIMDGHNPREIWQPKIEEESDCIGIFWKYKKAGKFKEWSES